MPHVLNTIIPVFVVIALGWLLRVRGFLPSGLMGSLNRMVYYLALPALIFREIVGASGSIQIDSWLLVGTLTPLRVISLLALVTVKPLSVNTWATGTFIQSASHGNLGYIGLAVGYYHVGVDVAEFLPGLILMASPTASVAYVMATEMGGNPDLAAASIPIGTRASSITYVGSLSLFG